MVNKRDAAWLCARRHGWLPVLAGAALAATGCVDWSYERIRIGQEARQVERTFPEEFTRRSELGLVYLQTDSFGRTDAVVVLFTRDRRVSGKLNATYYERNYGFRVETGYRLRGELDPVLAELAGTGPIDTLRTIATELATYEGDKLAKDGHAWIAAGLVRLIQRWPGGADASPVLPQLAGMLEHVPGGGDAQLNVDGRGVYLIEYVQGAAR